MSSSNITLHRRSKAPLFWAQDPIYLRIFKVLLFVIQPQITGPLYVRLAFHDAATWNKNATNKGGCASLRTCPGHIFIVLPHVSKYIIIQTSCLPCAEHSATQRCLKQGGLTAVSSGRANGSIRYEFAWPSNGGLQRFAWPLLYVSALKCMSSPIVCSHKPSKPMWLQGWGLIGLLMCSPQAEAGR